MLSFLRFAHKFCTPLMECDAGNYIFTTALCALGWQQRELVRELSSLKKTFYPVQDYSINFSQHKGRSLAYQMGKEGKSLLVF